MIKPEGISEEIWERAEKVYDAIVGEDTPTWKIEHIARAILNERNNVAKIAEDMLRFADTTSGADKAISQAIRNGGK